MRETIIPYTLGLLADMNQTMFIQESGSPIFIPRKHPKLKYADHKRMKAKRKNKQRRK